MNSESIYFGTTVIGESLNRKIQLVNKGALGTKFKLMTVKDFEKSKEPKKDDADNTDQIELENHEVKFEELKIGGIREGPIGPFSTVDLEFVFFPTFPGKFNEQFVIRFEDEDSKEV